MPKLRPTRTARTKEQRGKRKEKREKSLWLSGVAALGIGGACSRIRQLAADSGNGAIAEPRKARPEGERTKKYSYLVRGVSVVRGYPP
jgi:hypothetical protein